MTHTDGCPCTSTTHPLVQGVRRLARLIETLNGRELADAVDALAAAIRGRSEPPTIQPPTGR